MSGEAPRISPQDLTTLEGAFGRLRQQLNECDKQHYTLEIVALQMRSAWSVAFPQVSTLPEAVAVALVQWAVSACSYGKWTVTELLTTIRQGDSGDQSLLPSGFDKARVARGVCLGKLRVPKPQRGVETFPQLLYHANTSVSIVGWRRDPQAEATEGFTRLVRYVGTRPTPPPHTPHPTHV